MSPWTAGLWFVRIPHADNFGLICSFFLSDRDYAAGIFLIPLHGRLPCFGSTLPTVKRVGDLHSIIIARGGYLQIGELQRSSQ